MGNLLNFRKRIAKSEVTKLFVECGFGVISSPDAEKALDKDAVVFRDSPEISSIFEKLTPGSVVACLGWRSLLVPYL